MKRTLARLETNPRGASLYILGVSTVQALRLFAPEAALEINHVSGYAGQGASAQYVARQDLPLLTSAGAAVRHLEAETFALIDFDAVVDGVALSTHDDGEATFRTASLARAIELLEAVTKAPAVAAAALRHPGKYVLIEGETETVFDTFDQAVDSGRLSSD